MNDKFLLASGYHKLDLDVSVAIGEDTSMQLDPDLMFIKFIMCHEGENRNGDTFTKEVLQTAQRTPVYKPVDWEHGQPMIGHITESAYAEDANGVGRIEATGLVWKFIYPELAQTIKEKAPSGELKLSMECYFKNATYKVGDQLFTQDQAESMGIIPYVGRDYMGKHVSRIFSDVIFGGVGVVAKPADREAVFLAVAKDLGTDTIDASISRPVNDFTTKTHSQESSDAVAIARFIKAFDKAKSNVVAKFNAKELKTKEQVLAEVSSSVSTLMSEIALIGNSYYNDVANLQSEDYSNIKDAFESSIALNTEDQEVYLKVVEKDHVIYDIINYSDDNVSTVVASFSVDNENNISIDFANASQLIEEEENVIMEDKTTNEPVVDNKTAEELAIASAKLDEYEAKIASLELSLADEAKKVSAYEAKIQEFEARFAEIEADKLATSRLADLQEAGIVFSEARLAKEQAKLRVMTEDAYADYKELLAEITVASKKIEEPIVEEPVVASEDLEEEEEISLEGAKGSDLNVETPAQATKNPFGHLLGK